MIALGNSASPRWFGMTLEGLDKFASTVAAWGATSTELVLHHGPADEQIARVHILESDWKAVGNRFIAEGIRCHVHAPLHPRFSLRRWRMAHRNIEEEYVPVLREAAWLAERQSAPCVVVLHGANEREVSDDFNRASTVEFLTWAIERCEREWPGVRLAVELRRRRGDRLPQWDGSRDSIVDLVARLASDRLGICWDCGHDWENRDLEVGWTPDPSEQFLRHVVHVHVHDAGSDGSVHYPLTVGSVPVDEQMAALRNIGYEGAVTMEIRYRNALACGDPLAVLRQSYARLTSLLDSSPRQHSPDNVQR